VSEYVTERDRLAQSIREVGAEDVEVLYRVDSVFSSFGDSPALLFGDLRRHIQRRFGEFLELALYGVPQVLGIVGTVPLSGNRLQFAESNDVAFDGFDGVGDPVGPVGR